MSKTLTEIAQIISKIEDDLYDKADEMIALHRGFRHNQERIRELESLLEAVLDCGSVNDQWWVDRVKEALEPPR